MSNYNQTVLDALKSHLVKYQSYLELLKEPTDAKIREQVYESCAVAAYNEDFLPILKHVATAIIQVIQKAPWEATIPLTKFLNYVFNAHIELKDLQDHELQYVQNCRIKLIKYLVESRLEIALSTMFRRLRYHIETNNSQIEENDDNFLDESRLIDFYNFRRQWRKKPGEEVLSKCLAQMDRQIKIFDEEWPQYDQHLLDDEIKAEEPKSVEAKSRERNDSKRSERRGADINHNSVKLDPVPVAHPEPANEELQLNLSPKSSPKISDDEEEEEEVLMPVALPMPESTTSLKKASDDEINLGEHDMEDQEDLFTKRIREGMSIEVDQNDQEDVAKNELEKVDDKTPKNSIAPTQDTLDALDAEEPDQKNGDQDDDNMDIASPSEEDEEEEEEPAAKQATVALDTVDLRLLHTNNASCETTDLRADCLTDFGQQYRPETDDKMISVNFDAEKELKNSESQTDVTCFVESKEDQDKHLMNNGFKLLKNIESLMVNKSFTDYSIKFSFLADESSSSNSSSSVVSNPDMNSRVREVIPDLCELFPGAEIAGDQEVIFDLHRMIVYIMCPKLIEFAGKEGANLNWSDYVTLVAGCALVSYIYTRIVDFSNVSKMAERIYIFHQSRIWDGNDLDETAHEIFLKIGG